MASMLACREIGLTSLSHLESLAEEFGVLARMISRIAGTKHFDDHGFAVEGLARCTWARDAEPMGNGENHANIWPQGQPKSASI